MISRLFGPPYDCKMTWCRACKNYIKLDNNGKYICNADLKTYITHELDDNYDAICRCHNKNFIYENK